MTDTDTKARYERAVSVVRHQTTPAQHPGVTTRVVCQILVADGPFDDAAGVEAALRKAASDGALVRWTDDTGVTRYTPTKPVGALQRAVRWAGERGLSDALARLNPALAEVREDG
jgi:hypothetical protein